MRELCVVPGCNSTGLPTNAINLQEGTLYTTLVTLAKEKPLLIIN